MLVARGDREVRHAVAANTGARFSDTALASLVERSDEDDALQMAIGRRRDLPPQLFRALVAKATQAVQKRLLAIAHPHDAREVQRGARHRRRPHQRRDRAAQARLRRRQAHGGGRCASATRCNEIQIQTFAFKRRFEELVVALPVLTGVPLEVAERRDARQPAGPGADPRQGRRLRLADRARHRSSSGPRRAGMAPAALDKALAHFECLSVQTAQRVVRFWRVRRNALTRRRADTNGSESWPLVPVADFREIPDCPKRRSASFNGHTRQRLGPFV